MGFTGRVLRGATESSALGVADRAKPELGKVLLTTVEFIAEARIPYGVVEDNVAQGTFVDYATKLLAQAVSRDMEDVVVNGDTSSADLLYKKMNGILKQQTSYVVAAGGVKLTKSVFDTMVKTMPSQYFRGAKSMAMMTSKNAAIDYVSSLANRQTPLGDASLVKMSAGEYMGLPVIPIPVFPENLGAGTNSTKVVLADPKNINVGIQREIRIETDKDISAREYIIVATVRFDVKWAHEPATVQATGVLASA
jgi:HK97 family phage major capsid protein